jgi:hypothetical protein
LNSNSQQIKSFETTSKTDYLKLKNLFSDVIDFSDSLLWVTKTNKDINDSFEDYIWAKASILLAKTKKELLSIIKFKKEDFDKVNIEKFSVEDFDDLFTLWEQWYPKVIAFLDNLEKVLDNSIENINFPRTQIDWYKTRINWYQSELQSKYNAFLNLKSTVTKFLNTYKSNEEILKRSLDIWASSAQVTYNKILLDSEKALNNSLLSLKTARLNLENAIKTKEVTLKQLKNAINISKNSNSLAYKEYSKLLISSPINWVVSDVLVDVGQDVSVWTPLVKLSGLGKNEIEIWLSFSEVSFIKIWNKVNINYLWNKLEWNISAISKVADSNLNYKTKISINSKISVSWNIVEVLIPINLGKNIIPLKLLKVKSEGIWEINTLKNSKLNKVLVNFGEFYWEYVEIIWCKEEQEDCENLEIITNDISNFDEEKFNIVVK